MCPWRRRQAAPVAGVAHLVSQCCSPGERHNSSVLCLLHQRLQAAEKYCRERLFCALGWAESQFKAALASGIQSILRYPRLSPSSAAAQ